MRITIILALLLTASSCAAADELTGVGNIRMDVFSDTGLKNKVYSGLVPNIDFLWRWDAPVSALKTPRDFSVRLRGFLRAPRNGTYKILINADDGVRMNLNGVRVIDDWKSQSRPREVSVKLTVKPQPFEIEYFEGKNLAHLTMFWQVPGARSPHIVPAAAFVRSTDTTSRPPEIINGFNVSYYDKSLERSFGKGRQCRAETNWHTFAPADAPVVDGCARYTGFIIPPLTGDYQFAVWGDNRIAVWLDDEPLADYTWRKKKQVAQKAFRTLTQGVPVRVRIDFYDRKGGSSWFIHWKPPGVENPVSIPEEAIFPTKRSISQGQ